MFHIFFGHSLNNKGVCEGVEFGPAIPCFTETGGNATGFSVFGSVDFKQSTAFHFLLIEQVLTC